MQILASVDESDIGHIHNGQTVRFTVQAYPDDTFTGTVGQVRMQSSVDEHVVDYTVVVRVDNRDGKLLPGMTATANFLVERDTNVFKVLNAALRFRPTDAMRAQLGASGAQDRPEGGQADSTGGHSGPLASRSGEPEKGMQMLWYADDSGKLNAMPVRTGITDGQYTAIQGRDLTEGMNVIAGITGNSNASASSPSSPFQSPRQQGGPRRPPGM
jgi:HlyD family secretion protein